MKILKVYTGITSGTLGGRDDGHPVTKYKLYNSVDDLVNVYNIHHNEQYFELKEIPMDKMVSLVRSSLQIKERNERKSKRQEIENQIAELQGELEELES